MRSKQHKPEQTESYSQAVLVLCCLHIFTSLLSGKGLKKVSSKQKTGKFQPWSVRAYYKGRLSGTTLSTQALNHIFPERGLFLNPPTFISPMDPSPTARTSNCFFLPPDDVELSPWPQTTSAGFITCFCSCFGTNDQTWDWWKKKE